MTRKSKKHVALRGKYLKSFRSKEFTKSKTNSIDTNRFYFRPILLSLLFLDIHSEWMERVSGEGKKDRKGEKEWKSEK